MAKYRSLMTEEKWVEVNGRPILVAPEEVVDFPDDWLAGRYMQVGDFGEEPQWELVTTTKDKAAKAKSETEEN